MKTTTVYLSNIWELLAYVLTPLLRAFSTNSWRFLQNFIHSNCGKYARTFRHLRAPYGHLRAPLRTLSDTLRTPTGTLRPFLDTLRASYGHPTDTLRRLSNTLRAPYGHPTATYGHPTDTYGHPTATYGYLDWTLDLTCGQPAAIADNCGIVRNFFFSCGTAFLVVPQG